MDSNKTIPTKKITNMQSAGQADGFFLHDVDFEDNTSARSRSKKDVPPYGVGDSVGVKINFTDKNGMDHASLSITGKEYNNDYRKPSGEKPESTYQPNSDPRQDSIERQCSLKAAVEFATGTMGDENKVLEIAQLFNLYIKNQLPKN